MYASEGNDHEVGNDRTESHSRPRAFVFMLLLQSFLDISNSKGIVKQLDILNI